MNEEDQDEDEANKDVLPETIDHRKIKVEAEEAPKGANPLLRFYGYPQFSTFFILNDFFTLTDFLSSLYFPSSLVFVLMENGMESGKKEMRWCCQLPIACCLGSRFV